MPSPDANRVRIIGEELIPELECQPEPLPERLKILLELLDAAECATAARENDKVQSPMTSA